LSYGEWFLFLPFVAGAWAGLQPKARLEQVANRCPDAWLVGAYLTTTTAACLLVVLPRRIVGGGLLWSPSMPVFILCLSVVVTLIIVRASYARGLLHRLLTTRPLLALGRISFSFFLLHTIVLGVVLPLTEPYFNGTFGSGAVLAVATFGLSWALATVLYEFAEKPYFAFRNREVRAADAPRGSTGTSMQ